MPTVSVGDLGYYGQAGGTSRQLIEIVILIAVVARRITTGPPPVSWQIELATPQAAPLAPRRCLVLVILPREPAIGHGVSIAHQPGIEVLAA
jgi:hypothetical protein